MSAIQDILDEQQALATARIPWEAYWRDITMYVLPQVDAFENAHNNTADAVSSVVGTPVAADKSKHLYDMTSLWGIERLSAGLLSLKTPETEYWHGLESDGYFGNEVTHDEMLALERLRNYLFRVRGNPQTGFWDAHRAAIKSTCAFGDGYVFVGDDPAGGVKAPTSYEYFSLPELYPGVNDRGVLDRMFRVYRRSAVQIAARWGEKAGKKVIDAANDPSRKHEKIVVMHAVRPRSDMGRANLGVRGSAFESHYLLPDDKHHIGESGFFEMPYIRYSWSNSGARPFSEGPVAYALAEIKSLQEMAKNELIGVQTLLRPAYAVHGRNFNRLKLNPGSVNAGLVNAEGKPLFAPMSGNIRPDFAATVLEQRRGAVREMLYLSLWQSVLQEKDETATGALIRAQEKGELLGPVGLSLNGGLSRLIDREVSVLNRSHAFDAGSPLEMPETMADRDVAPVFTSPLDRLRRLSELVGMQRLVEFATMLAGNDPERGAKILARFDVDEMLDQAREILGAPAASLRDMEAVQQGMAAEDQMKQLMGAMSTLQASGEAAKSFGEGATAAAAGATAAANTPELTQMLTQAVPAGTQAAQVNARRNGAA